jgi:hypothetical protein
MLGLERYSCHPPMLMAALSHKGKKYERLYLPKSIRALLKEHVPSVLDKIATGNGDMFGNVIADDVGLYRAGFGDALSALFNKLLDYKIEKCGGIIGEESTVRLRFGGDISSSIGDRVIHVRTSDGSLWEPFFDGDTKIKLNPSHSFYSAISDSKGPVAIFQLLLKMAEIEANSQTSKELQLREDFRLHLSRQLNVVSVRD